MDRETVNILAGAVALTAAFGALAWASTGGGRSEVSGSYLVTARFSQADGIAVGSPVHLAGTRVGSVARLEIDPATLKAIVTMSLRRGVEIPADSGALILSDGVFGGKFIRIEPGSDTSNLTPGASFMHRQDAVIAEQILDKIVRGAEARRKSGK